MASKNVMKRSQVPQAKVATYYYTMELREWISGVIQLYLVNPKSSNPIPPSLFPPPPSKSASEKEDRSTWHL